MASIYSSSSCNSVPSFAVITLSEIDSLHTANASEIRVYLALAAHAGPDGDCWPGRRRLAEITGQSREHVSRSTSALEAAGLIEKSQTPTGRTIYHLPLHRRPMPVSEREPTPYQIGHPPMPDPAPVEQIIEQTKNLREAEPPPPAEPAPVTLSEVVLRTAKTTAPDCVPASWIEAGQLLRPELPVEVIRQSAEIFLDHHRAKGTVLVDWLPAFRVWLRRERAPKAPSMAHKALATPTVPSPYAGPNFGTVAQETAEEASEKFAAQMARYGAVPGEGGTWNRPGAAVPVTPQTPAPVAATIPPIHRTLTADQARQIAELAAAGTSPREVAAALGRG